MTIDHAPHDDPGRSHPDGNGGMSNDNNIQKFSKIVNVGNSGTEKVQLTGRVRFPYLAETMKKLYECVRGEASNIDMNGETRHVAQDGGLLRHPPGATTDGTIVDVFPILLVDEQYAAAVAQKLAAVLQNFSSSIENVVSLGLVVDGQREILGMIEQEARQQYEQKFPHMRTELRLITDDE